MPERLKHIIISLIFAAAALSCTEHGGLKGPSSIFMHLSAEPDTLNPVTATDAYSSRINSYIYESLVERDRDTLKIIPKLAAKWEISADKLRYRFFLRKGIMWHDGKEFTADDVVYSYSVLKDKRTINAHLKVYYMDVESVKKVDRYTVDFKYKKKYFLGLEICGSMPVVPAHIFNDGTDFNSHKNGRSPVGTGPYKFVKWDTGKKIILEADERYWDKKPSIKRIVFALVQEGNVAFQMLKKGELDVYQMRPIQWVRQTGSGRFSENFYKIKYSLPQYSYIGWNAKSELFKDKKVRLAMTRLINRNEILEKLLFGLGETINGTFYIHSRNYSKNLKEWTFNPDSAKKLLKNAGWTDSDGDGILDKNGKKFSFTFTITSASKFSERLTTIIKEDFSRYGIEINIIRYEWAVFIDKLQKRDFDAVTGAWSLGYGEDPYQLWHSSQAVSGSNYCSFVNAEADAILEKARMEFDENKRIKLYHRFNEIVHEEQPYTFLYANPELKAVSRKFTNVRVHLQGLDTNEWGVAVQP